MKLKQLIDKYEKEALKYDLEPEATKLLIMELSGFTPNEFYLNINSKLNTEQLNKIELGLREYLDNKTPIQHILGFAYFYGYKFNVNKDVLIPRRETEELVYEILSIYDQYFNNEKINALDLGTGSGCIAITLTKEETNLTLTAADISEEALVVAKSNNEKLETNVTFLTSNWFSNITGKYSIIIANPPYVPNDEEIAVIVKKEPKIALYGGLSGTEAYEEILKNAKPFLNEMSLIAFEHGYQQAEAIKALATKYYKDAVIVQKKDMQNKDRMTFIGIGGVLN